MKKRKYAFLGILLVVCFVFTGCGEQMYELTDEEAAMIADYSAKIVAKHNKAQSVGLCAVADSSKDEEENTENANTSEENNINTQAGNEQNTDTEVASVSMTDALEVEGISFAYHGFEVQSEYQSSEYFMLTPNQGYSYLVYKFDGTNTTEQDIKVDLLSKNLIMRATVNDSVTAAAETTILLNDLTTYSDTIAAGTTKSFVILFQVKSDVVSNITTLGLQLKNDGQTQEILLQ